MDLERARLGDTQTPGARERVSVFEPVDVGFRKLSDGTLDDQGGVGEEVGVTTDCHVEALLLLGLDVDVVPTDDEWTLFGPLLITSGLGRKSVLNMVLLGSHLLFEFCLGVRRRESCVTMETPE